MEPTGGEIMDKMIADIPIFANALSNNNLTTINRLLKNTQKSMIAIAPHITHAQLREIAAERIDAFHSLVYCMEQGKCGFQAHVYYLYGCMNPCKTLFASIVN